MKSVPSACQDVSDIARRNLAFADPDYVKRWKPKNFLPSKQDGGFLNTGAAGGTFGISDLAASGEANSTGGEEAKSRGQEVVDLYLSVIGDESSSSSGKAWRNGAASAHRTAQPPASASEKSSSSSVAAAPACSSPSASSSSAYSASSSSSALSSRQNHVQEYHFETPPGTPPGTPPDTPPSDENTSDSPSRVRIKIEPGLEQNHPQKQEQTQKHESAKKRKREQLPPAGASMWNVHAPMPARHQTRKRKAAASSTASDELSDSSGGSSGGGGGDLQGFFCPVCKLHAASRWDHEASTLHIFNVRAAAPGGLEGLRVRGHVTIPESNRGHQMLRALGWAGAAAGAGLGSRGQGRLEPVPTVFKQTKKGVGAGGRKEAAKVTHFPAHVEPLDAVPDARRRALERAAAREDAVRHLSAEAGLRQLAGPPRSAGERRRMEMPQPPRSDGGSGDGAAAAASSSAAAAARGVEGGRHMSKAKLAQEKLDWRKQRENRRRRKREQGNRTGKGACSGAGESKKQKMARLNAEQRASKRLRIEMEATEEDTLQLVPHTDRLHWSVEYDEENGVSACDGAVG